MGGLSQNNLVTFRIRHVGYTRLCGSFQHSPKEIMEIHSVGACGNMVTSQDIDCQDTRGNLPRLSDTPVKRRRTYKGPAYWLKGKLKENTCGVGMWKHNTKQDANVLHTKKGRAVKKVH